MSIRLASRRVLRPLAYASALTVAGGAGLYIAYRPRNIPGSDSAVVRPPRLGKDGVLIPPQFPTIKTRSEQIADLRRGGTVSDQLRLATSSASTASSSDDNEYDLLVIGGGATGTGIALDAATRGLKVALVERDDFSSGTSSKSTKLVHGGVRYLEKAVWNLDYNQYKLVKEALRERKYFLDTAPHLSSWLPIMLPLEKWYSESPTSFPHVTVILGA